ncbi:MAG: hypothetical protein BWZ08_00327 [candidate division BRC1 bacterium ADurb.BinA292]|nr:MAG: hypothetical protein BWZ08_00327 [candidate division BRC1 bacterium ADurb.BinA292]
MIEETGYEARHLERVGAGPTSSGLTNEVVAFYRARGLRKVGRGGGDASEAIEVHTVPLDQIVDWVKRKAAEDRLIEVNVYAGIFFARGFETVADCDTTEERP